MDSDLMKIKTWWLDVILYIFIFFACFFVYLFLTNQSLFPRYTARKIVGRAVNSAEILEGDSYRIYLFVNEDKLFKLSFTKKIFWEYDGMVTSSKTEMITAQVCGNSLWENKVVFGCCNEEIVQIEVLLRTGASIPLKLGKENTFIFISPKEGAAVIRGYNEEGKLVSQQFLEGY